MLILRYWFLPVYVITCILKCYPNLISNRSPQLFHRSRAPAIGFLNLSKVITLLRLPLSSSLSFSTHTLTVQRHRCPVLFSRGLPPPEEDGGEEGKEGWKEEGVLSSCSLSFSLSLAKWESDSAQVALITHSVTVCTPISLNAIRAQGWVTDSTLTFSLIPLSFSHAWLHWCLTAGPVQSGPSLHLTDSTQNTAVVLHAFLSVCLILFIYFSLPYHVLAKLAYKCKAYLQHNSEFRSKPKINQHWNWKHNNNKQTDTGTTKHTKHDRKFRGITENPKVKSTKLGTMIAWNTREHNRRRTRLQNQKQNNESETQTSRT